MSLLALDRRLLPLRERDEIVFADALQDQKYRGRVARVGDEVRSPRRNGIGLPRRQPHVLLRLLKKDSDRARYDIKRVVDVAVVMPRHFLRRADLQLGNAKARTRGVNGPALDLIEPTRILYALHGGHHGLPVNTIVTGLAFLVTSPVGVSLPEPVSTRNVTTVSPCSLAAWRKRPAGSRPMKRGPRPCVDCHPTGDSDPSVALTANSATLSWPRLEQ